MTRGLAILLAAALVGSIHLAYAPKPSSVEPAPVEVGFGRLAADSTAGVNATNATASVVGSLLGATTHVLHLNSTDADAAWHARIRLHDATGVGNLLGLDVGIDNGTAQVSQILASAGALTQTEGPDVRLEPGSASTIYVTQTVGVQGVASTLHADVRVSDQDGGASYYVMKLRLDVA